MRKIRERLDAEAVEEDATVAIAAVRLPATAGAIAVLKTTAAAAMAASFCFSTISVVNGVAWTAACWALAAVVMTAVRPTGADYASDPPARCEPCDHHGNWVGPSTYRRRHRHNAIPVGHDTIIEGEVISEPTLAPTAAPTITPTPRSTRPEAPQWRPRSSQR